MDFMNARKPCLTPRLLGSENVEALRAVSAFRILSLMHMPRCPDEMLATPGLSPPIYCGQMKKLVKTFPHAASSPRNLAPGAGSGEEREPMLPPIHVSIRTVKVRLADEEQGSLQERIFPKSKFCMRAVLESGEARPFVGALWTGPEIQIFNNTFFPVNFLSGLKPLLSSSWEIHFL